MYTVVYNRCPPGLQLPRFDYRHPLIALPAPMFPVLPCPLLCPPVLSYVPLSFPMSPAGGAHIVFDIDTGVYSGHGVIADYTLPDDVYLGFTGRCTS